MEYHPVVAESDSKITAFANADPKTIDVRKFEHPEKLAKYDAAVKAVLASQGARKPQERLTQEQVDKFKRDGWVLVPSEQMWSEQDLTHLLQQVFLMDDWPEMAGHWMKYYEKNKLKGTPGHESEPDKILQRIENFLDYNKYLNELINGQRMLGMITQLFGEDAVLYKEKINYKLPGGDGFNPHQDVAAGWWMYGQDLHISVLIGIDNATKQNGALELVSGWHKKGLLGPQWKEVPADLCAQMQWEMAETRPGDICFFDSFVPHRSGPNFTEKPRRVLYTTYAKAAQGDLRARYYADKRKSFPPDIEREQGKSYEYKI